MQGDSPYAPKKGVLRNPSMEQLQMRCLSLCIYSLHASSVHRLYHIDWRIYGCSCACILSSVPVHLLTASIFDSDFLDNCSAFLSFQRRSGANRSLLCEKEARNRLLDGSFLRDFLPLKYFTVHLKYGGGGLRSFGHLKFIKWLPGVRVPVWPFRM